MALKLKLDADGHVVVQDGKPVYTDDVDGKELAFDAEQMRGKINELNTESKTHRLSAKEKAELLEKFGDAKPEEVAALRATLAELGGPEGLAKLKETAKTDVEAIKRSISENYESQLATERKAREEDAATIRTLAVGNGFATSKFLAETTLTARGAEAMFGHAFKTEGGKAVGYLNGEKIYSRERPGELASFDEAFRLVFANDPDRDSYTKASGGGSGAQQSQGSGKGDSKTISRAEFTAKSPAEQSALAIARVTITD